MFRYGTLRRNFRSFLQTVPASEVFIIGSQMTLASATADAQSLFSSDRRQITWKTPAIFFPVGRLNGLDFRNGGQETSNSSATAEAHFTNSSATTEVNFADCSDGGHLNKIFKIPFVGNQIHGCIGSLVPSAAATTDHKSLNLSPIQHLGDFL